MTSIKLNMFTNNFLKSSHLVSAQSRSLSLTSIVSFKNFPLKPVEKIIGYPDSNKLKNVPKTPTPHANTSLLTMTKRLADIRGPELVHNKLIHKQYGIVALSGGNLTIGHFEMLRNTINRFMDLTKAFAVYRVDPPWKPVTRHGQGKKLGGGKGGIEFYVTPVKRGRVIVEIGGLQTREMLTRVMVDLAQKMPFPAKFVSQADLEAWDAEELFIKQNNINKLRWEWCMKNNIMNVIQYSGKYDIDFSEFGPDCR